VSLCIGEKVVWLDYTPSFVVAATATEYFSAVSCADGSLSVYSPHGRRSGQSTFPFATDVLTMCFRLMPTVMLDSPLSFIDSANHSLLAITARGKLFVWCAQPFYIECCRRFFCD
jgi:protein HIRA/HIR1